MKQFLRIGLLVAVMTGAARADFTNLTFLGGFNNGGVIPDANLAGWSDTRMVNLGDFGSTNMISNLDVTLNLSGGFNGDLYGFLVHDTGFAVLLNRSGRDGGNPFGYADSGFNVTFSDLAANGNIHFYRDVLNPGGGVLTGIWAPDGRNVHPLTTTGLEVPSTFLSDFAGLTLNGSWTLFMADLSAGGSSTVLGWGLNITTVPVPEPGALALGVVGLAAVLLARRRKK